MTRTIALTCLSTAALLYGCGGGSKQEADQSAKQTDQDSAQQAPNILFIAIDDLRPELGCYGVDLIQSPNIDRLASQSLQFNRAYCNIPVSGASRASILTGTRPTRNTWVTFHDTIQVMRPDAPTLGKYFKDNGYYTIHNGKVMHHPGDASGSWDDEWWPQGEGSWRNYADAINIAMDTTGDRRGPAFERITVPDNAYKDGKTAEKTIEDLKKLKKSGKPFFLAAGFLKPHLPFNAPEKYWALYDSTDIVLPTNTGKPQDAPDEAMHDWGELRAYKDIPATGPLTDQMAHTLKHGYYACVSYTDAQIGKILNALDSLGLSENTIVVLWGDHGWNLREHGLWCKHCNFETSLHVPLLIRAPGYQAGQSNAITEFVDVYPTLCELAGIPIPDHAEGSSLVPVLKDPENQNTDGIAVCRWREGFTIIHGNNFYTEWSDSSGQVYADMLYDHIADPDENTNISKKEEAKGLVEKLSKLLHQKWGEHINL